MPQFETEVAIVGARPSGLVAACLLQHFGIKYIIFDKKTEPTATSNAIFMNARTLQLLKPLGISEQLIQAGMKLRGNKLYSKQTELISINADTEPTVDFLLTLPQAKTEAILRGYLSQRGSKVEHCWELISQQPQQDAVEIYNLNR